MSGGKRFKFTGSSIAFGVSFDASSPSPAISNITQANPAVVTSAGHGLSNGDVIKIYGAVGMTEVNDGVFVVAGATTNTFQLSDVDSSGYGAYTSGGHFDELVFSNFCELTNYNRSGAASPEIQATSLCSTSAEFEIGLPDFGTTQMDYLFAPRTNIQLALQSFYRSGEKTAIKVTLPNDGGVMVQVGFVQQTSETAGNGTIWTGSTTIRNTGPRVDFAA